jgi:hypothetical protein
MPLTPSEFLSLCLNPETSQQDCLRAMGRGDALRHYRAAQGHEPLSACAERGWLEAINALLDRAHFEPFEEALDAAATCAASHGHVDCSMALFKFGATPERHAAWTAIDRGFEEPAARLGAAEFFGPLPDSLACVLWAFCSHGVDAKAAELVAAGAALHGPDAERGAKDIALHNMSRAAHAWLARQAPLPPAARSAWQAAFGSLLLACDDHAALEAAAMAAPAARRARGL